MKEIVEHARAIAQKALVVAIGQKRILEGVEAEINSLDDRLSHRKQGGRSDG